MGVDMTNCKLAHFEKRYDNFVLCPFARVVWETNAYWRRTFFKCTAASHTSPMCVCDPFICGQDWRQPWLSWVGNIFTRRESNQLSSALLNLKSHETCTTHTHKRHFVSCYLLGNILCSQWRLLSNLVRLLSNLVHIFCQFLPIVDNLWHHPCLGDRLHMLRHHRHPDGGRHLNGRLDAGRWLEGGPLPAVHQPRRPHSPPIRHGASAGLLQGEGCG